MKTLRKQNILRIILAFIACMVVFPSITAHADTRTQLATPTNLHWVEGEDLTIAWDAVENAGGYYVSIHSEGSESFTNSWTVETSRDLVSTIARSSDFVNGSGVYVIVQATVVGGDKNSYLRFIDSESVESPRKAYVLPAVVHTSDGIDFAPTAELLDSLKNSISEEQQAEAVGKTLSFEFSMNGIEEGAEGTEAISEYANNNDYTVGEFFDLSLIVKADGVSIGNVTATTAAVPLTVAVPADLQKDGRIFFILKNHEGVITEVGRGTGTQVPISTAEFSTYAIAYQDIKAGDDEDRDDEVDEIVADEPVQAAVVVSDATLKAPKTGERCMNSLVWVMLATAGMVSGVMAKKGQKRER